LITAWRIVKATLAAAAFEGHGAAKFPGRWNPLGARVAYTAENRSLAALEVLANAGDRDELTKGLWSIIPVRFNPSLIYSPTRVPSNWREVPTPDSTRLFGGAWAAKGASAVLKVPSAVTLGEFNFILNPIHPDFSKIKVGRIENFKFNPRTM
jgi:RES domain-containing protein